MPRDPATTASRHRRTRAAGGWRLLVPVALLLAGLLGTTSAVTARGTDLRAGGAAGLADGIRAEQRRVEQRVAEVERLRADVDTLTQRLGGGEPARDAALDEAAGLTPARGPALTVVLDDAPRRPGEPLPPGTTGDDVIVHQQDVQAVVNAMWAGGAEAMQLMDQRVISTSAVRCVGNVLLLQGRPYPPPYRITAIGPVAAMRAALRGSRAVQVYREYVDTVGLRYVEEVHDAVTVPAYTGTLALEQARVAT